MIKRLSTVLLVTTILLAEFNLSFGTEPSQNKTHPLWPPVARKTGTLSGKLYFSEYPYSIGDDGLFTPNYRKERLLQFGTHYLYHDSNLQGFIFWLDFAPSTLFNLTTQYTDITRRFPGGYDHYRFYDLYLDYFQIRTRQFVMSWGVGAKGESTGKLLVGPAVHLTADAYFKKPFSANMRASVGKIGSHWLTQFFLRFNWHYQGNAFYLGYNYYSRGSVNLDGAVLGVSVYF